MGCSVKKIGIALSVLFLLVLFMLPLTASAQTIGTVTGGYVYLRAGRGTQYDILCGCLKGSQVTVLESGTDWLKVSYKGLEGFISAAYVSVGQEEPSAEEPTALTATGTVTGSVVNVRSGPGSTHKVVATFLKGRSVTVTGQSGDWYRIDNNGTAAYIKNTLIELTDGTVADNTGSALGTGTVTGGSVNVRSGPGTVHKVVGSTYRGQSFTVTGEQNGWYQIQFNGSVAYISASYLTLSASAGSVDVGTVNVDSVNIRSGAGTGTSVIGTACFGETFTINDTQNNWCSVTGADGLKGYICASYLTKSQYSGGTGQQPAAETPTETEPVVTPMSAVGSTVYDALNIRSAPSTSASVLATLTVGVRAEVTGSSDGWYQVSFQGKTGYVSAKYFYICTESPATETETDDITALQQQIVDYAMTFIGTPYRWAGADPSYGFDCSGLTQYVYKHFGYNINRSSQYTEGTAVSYNDLQPGDLVFFDTKGAGISHVGMYVGNGQFIHAPCVGKTVCLTQMKSVFYADKFVCAVRIV